MQKIIPHLWFNTEAKEAAEFYTSVFGNSKIKNIKTIRNRSKGPVDIVKAQLDGQDFILISTGPSFKLNPAVSFLIACETKEEVQDIWNKLVDGGSVLMEVGKYDFSDLYGWLKDKYGTSWQIMFDSEHAVTQKITPTLMFVGEIYGRGRERNFPPSSLFKNSKICLIFRHFRNEKSYKKRSINERGFNFHNYSKIICYNYLKIYNNTL